MLYYDRSDSFSELLPIVDLAISEGPVCFEPYGEEGYSNKTYYPLLNSTPDSCD